MPQQAWGKKRERQYEKVKRSQKQQGRGEDTAEEIAARTVVLRQEVGRKLPAPVLVTKAGDSGEFAQIGIGYWHAPACPSLCARPRLRAVGRRRSSRHACSSNLFIANACAQPQQP